MVYTELEQFQHLNTKNCEDYVAKTYIVESDQQKLFNKDEFEFAVHDYDYIQYNLINRAFETIIDMVGVTGMRFEFEDETVDDYVNNLQVQERLRQFVFDAKTFGSSYLQVTVEDNYYTADESDSKLCVYNVTPNSVFAKYDDYNLQRPARYYSIVHKKELIKDDKVEGQAILVIDFYPAKIIYSAFKQTGKGDNLEEEIVNPMDYFPELFSDDFEAQKEGESWIIETNNTYSNLHAWQYLKPQNSFYGKGEIDLGTTSKLNAINRYANLATQTVIDNTQPPLELTSAAMKKINQSIEEVTAGSSEKQEGNTFPTSFLNNAKHVASSNRNFLNYWNFWESKVWKTFKKKLMAFESDGRGRNGYLNNPFDIQQALDLQDKMIDTLMSELYISQVLYKPDLATGASSGVALRRLMSLTLNHVTNLRSELEPILQRLGYNIVETAVNSGLLNASLENLELPEIVFEDLSEKELEEKIGKAEFLLNMGAKKAALQHGLELEPKLVEEITGELDNESEIKQNQLDENSNNPR